MESEMADSGLGRMLAERPPRSLVRQAVRAQGAVFDREALARWFDRGAPWVDWLAVEGYLEAGTVNEPNRRHYPEPEDLMYRRPDGLLERYDLRRHGRWSKLGER